MCTMQLFRRGEAVLVNGLPGTTHASVTQDGKVMVLIARGVVNVEVRYLWREDNFSRIFGGERVHIYGLPAEVSSPEEYEDGTVGIKFTGCGWHAHVHPQYLQRV